MYLSNLEKLIYFDVKSSYSITDFLQDVKNKYTYLITKEVTLPKEKIEEYTEYLPFTYFE